MCQHGAASETRRLARVIVAVAACAASSPLNAVLVYADDVPLLLRTLFQLCACSLCAASVNYVALQVGDFRPGNRCTSMHGCIAYAAGFACFLLRCAIVLRQAQGSPLAASYDKCSELSQLVCMSAPFVFFNGIVLPLCCCCCHARSPFTAFFESIAAI